MRGPKGAKIFSLVYYQIPELPGQSFHDLMKAHKIPVNLAGKVVLEKADGKQMQCEGSTLITVLLGTKKYKVEAIVSSSMKKDMLISHSNLKMMVTLLKIFP